MQTQSAHNPNKLGNGFRREPASRSRGIATHAINAAALSQIPRLNRRVLLKESSRIASRIGSRRSGFLSRLHRIARFPPCLHPAIERHRALKSHGAQALPPPASRCGRTRNRPGSGGSDRAAPGSRAARAGRAAAAVRRGYGRPRRLRARARRARSDRRSPDSMRALKFAQRHERHGRCGLGQHLATVLPPLMLVRSASVMCVGIARLRLRIISTNAPRSRFCRRGLSAISSPMVECARPLYSCAGYTLSAGSSLQQAARTGCHGALRRRRSADRCGPCRR